jgi:hypothetical protein
MKEKDSLFFNFFFCPLGWNLVFFEKTLGEPGELFSVIEGVFEVHAHREAVSLRMAVAYLSQEQSVIPLQLHGSAGWRRLFGEQAKATLGPICDPAQERGFVFA